MSLFDSLKDSASGLISSDAHTALNDALEKSPLGDVSGLLDKLHEGGLSSAVEAWSSGEDHPHVSPDQLREALGDEHAQQLAASMGINTDQLLAGLSEHLPALAAHDAGDDADHAHEDHDDDHADSDHPAAEPAHAEADEGHDDGEDHEAESHEADEASADDAVPADATHGEDDADETEGVQDEESADA